MKKIFSLSAAVILAANTFAFTASAEDTADAYVTIADGSLKLTQEKITVTDADGDGALTINDALYLAHEEFYDGGAAAGYASENTEYGISLVRLWGNDCGSYGYCINNVSAMSLSDIISDGDYINTYAYSDLTAWSDKYCFFDINSADITTDDEITLTMKFNGFDSEWNPLVLIYEGAEIRINGEDTGIVTDGEGKATISFDKEGEYIISAASDTDILVPPVCKVNVTAHTEAPATGNDTAANLLVCGASLLTAVAARGKKYYEA